MNCKAYTYFKTKLFISRFSLLITLLISHFSLLTVFAENEVSVRVAPVLELPELQQFNTGAGAAAVLDWSFLSFWKLNTGVSGGVGFVNMPIKTGDAFSFIDVSVGAFIRFRPFDRLSLQISMNTGVYQFDGGTINDDLEDSTYTKAIFFPSVGLDFYLSPYFSLYAEARYTHRVFSESTPFKSYGGTVGMRINITEFLGGSSRIKIDKSEQYRIFPVSWAWYEDNPVATVAFTNEEANTIRNVNLSFFMESYMGQPFSFAVIPKIAPGHTVEVPVTALFNDVMLNLTENINANGEIQVQYSSLGANKQAFVPIQMPIFHRNTISWDDDRRAASFVSPRDSAARIFSRSVVSAVNLHLESGRAAVFLRSYPKNVLYAAALFETLRIYGLSYVVDPTMSFVALSQDASALDVLTYPYESLHYRGGDCGHLSILFCSLMESLNIDTAFITVPGHIYMAFDVGDDTWQAGNPNIIEIETDGVKKRWFPVEITVPDEGFNRAWRIGARQWINHGDDAELLPLKDCWEIYPSVTVSASVDYPPEIPPVEDIIRALESELRNR